MTESRSSIGHVKRDISELMNRVVYDDSPNEDTAPYA